MSKYNIIRENKKRVHLPKLKPVTNTSLWVGVTISILVVG